MTTKTDSYIRGMQAINYFYSMLYAAMCASMPEAQISQSGAYVWRGYQIDSYKDLAYGQYYCLIYHDNPKVLVFEEGYKDPSHKASEMEIQNRIMQGRYYYPFCESLDLIRTRFFAFSRDEQFDFLKNFVVGAIKQAEIWQQSVARDEVTGNKSKKGKVPRYKPVRVPSTYEHVDEEFLQAWEYQSGVLMKLKGVLMKFPNREWVRPNASIYNFAFRGLRLKFYSSSVTSRWSIYFDDAECLKFQVPKGRINSYNLVEHRYFELEPEEQTSQLTGFAKASLGLKH